MRRSTFYGLGRLESFSTRLLGRGAAAVVAASSRGWRQSTLAALAELPSVWRSVLGQAATRQ